MANFTDFIRTHSSPKARLRRLYWVCGHEDVLRMLAVQKIREMAGVKPYNTAVLSVGDSPETEIWAQLNQHPLDVDQPRLLIVYGAHRLKHLDRLIDWLKDNQAARTRSATAVFVSEHGDLEESEEREAIMASSNAVLVRCSLPKDEADRLKRAQEIITGWGNIDRINAGILAQRVGFDLAEARAVMAKASLFPEARVTNRAIEMLAPRRIEAEVTWNLIALNRRAAIEAVMDGHANPYTLLPLLSTHVEMLGRLNGYLTTPRSLREVARELDAREMYVRLLYPYARLYPPPDTTRRLTLLARLDAAHMRGAKDGILESLIALW